MAEREKTVMLLPTISEARLIREAVSEWIGKHTGAEPSDIDSMYFFHTKLSEEIRKANS